MALVLVAKKGTTSPIWQFFGFRPDESGQPRDLTEAVCKICSCVIRAKDGQTTNLHDHLRVRHPANENERKKVSVHGQISTEISVHMCYQYSIRAGLQHSGECSYSNSQLIKTRQSDYVGISGQKHRNLNMVYVCKSRVSV